MTVQQGFNLSKNGDAKCLKAGYFKMGAANLLNHPDNGFAATGVLIYDIEDGSDDRHKE